MLQPYPTCGDERGWWAACQCWDWQPDGRSRGGTLACQHLRARLGKAIRGDQLGLPGGGSPAGSLRDCCPAASGEDEQPVSGKVSGEEKIPKSPECPDALGTTPWGCAGPAADHHFPNPGDGLAVLLACLQPRASLRGCCKPSFPKLPANFGCIHLPLGGPGFSHGRVPPLYRPGSFTKQLSPS